MVENPTALGLVIFMVLITMSIAIFARRFGSSAAEFYVANRGISALQSALSLGGSYMSAASFLGIVGLVWLHGYDGFAYGLGFFGGYVVLLFWIASPLRRFAKFTVADFGFARWHSQRVRMVCVIFTLISMIFYIVPQLVGSGALLHILMGWDYSTGVVVAAVLMTLYVVVGGMRGTTYNQIFLCVMLWGAMFITMIFVLMHYGWSYNAILVDVGRPYIYHGMWLDPINNFGLLFGLVLGTAGLPHILIQYYTNPTGKAARWATVGVLCILATFYFMTPIVGFAARAILGDAAGVNTALPLVGFALGGEPLKGIIVGGAFAAIVSTTAALLIACTGAIAHDLYTGIINPKASDKKQVQVAKVTTIVLGILSIGAGLAFEGYPVAFLVGLAFAIVASIFFPLLFMGIWWRGMTEKGALAGMIAGGISSLAIISTNLLGMHPLMNPAIITVPLAFLAIYFVSKWDGKVPDDVDELMYQMHSPTRDIK